LVFQKHVDLYGFLCQGTALPLTCI
jgi:hypothetical protein